MGLFQCNFFSYSLHRLVDVNIVIPTLTFGEVHEGTAVTNVHKTDKRYPVLYLLHGSGGDHSGWMRYVAVERYAEAHNIAVVMPSAENKFYANRPNGDMTYDFLDKELPDFISAFFPVSQRREDTYIAGLSMGGYGTLLHSLGSPKRYCAFGAFSPGVRVTGYESERLTDITQETRFDLFLALKQYEGRMDQLPKGYMACGEGDRLFEMNVKFKDQFLSQNGDLTWEQLPNYKHEWSFWDLQLQKFLAWIPRTDDCVVSKLREV